MRLHVFTQRLAAAGCLTVAAACSATAATGVGPVTAPAAGSLQSIARGSWIDARAATGDLLYVSDHAGYVKVLTYPGGTPAGSLTGFSSPAGLCSDPAGDVFVVDEGAEKVYAFKHGATKPYRTLFNFGAYPNGCSYDPTTGNLAVSNYNSSPIGQGSIGVYAGASGSPSKYFDLNVALFLFCAYDASGNLFADGVNAGTTQTQLVELPSGGSALQDLTIRATIGYPGGVAWDGKHLAIHDVSKGVLDRFNVSGSKATLAGTTPLNVPSHLVVQFALAGTNAIVPYGRLTRHIGRVGVWPYPKGGSPAQSFSGIGSQLYGVTLSVAP